MFADREREKEVLLCFILTVKGGRYNNMISMLTNEMRRKRFCESD